ncbi:hypothetical protein PQ796_01835 (plasmid) [Priestia megaterium]|uniref:hypothetical protein n=1 Tax=Priestia megaterium TaxID=1404 RepID=UPI0011558ACE|nr:hypothetical protein [Priestia megaterium]MDH2449338.1 hypothetical protein [Priestia megaterium]MDL5148796.1 hypothetical protein [Priestia megaterium]MDP9580400.1 hypothetical protein [Bacillus sp. 1751]MDP9726478.1 hypothetical protein [Priestia aryabhattai]
MHCLEPKDYYKIHNILKESFKTPTFAFSVVNHVIQGSVYVNDGNREVEISFKPHFSLKTVKL